MSLVEKHPSDDGKYQASFSDYGHGPGNGKSRQAVYKHARKLKANGITVSAGSMVSAPESSPQAETTDAHEGESVEATGLEWESITWSDDDVGDVTPHTIPAPLRNLASHRGGDLVKARRALQGQFVRWGFMTTDRLVTWWGRGVMANDKWELDRSPQDYDVLEGTTTSLMEAYDIEIAVNPWMVWGAVVGTAYVPPVMHVRKHATPGRLKKPKFISRILGFFKRKQRRSAQEVFTENEPTEDSESDFRP